MQRDFSSIVQQIDEQIRANAWFDFHVFLYDHYRLVIAGGIDLTYYHELEIIFEDVYFVQGFFQGWRSDTSQPVFVIPPYIHDLNAKYEIEEGYQLFVFRTEDFRNDVIIAASGVSYRTGTVFYYDRPDLKPGERIADFVKRE